MVTSLMVRLTRCSSCWDVSGIAHLLRPYRLNPLTPIGFIAYHSILYSVPHRGDSHEAGGPERVAPTSVMLGGTPPATAVAWEMTGTAVPGRQVGRRAPTAAPHGLRGPRPQPARFALPASWGPARSQASLPSYMWGTARENSPHPAHPRAGSYDQRGPLRGRHTA